VVISFSHLISRYIKTNGINKGMLTVDIFVGGECIGCGEGAVYLPSVL
jgi:hypothetical protein